MKLLKPSLILLLAFAMTCRAEAQENNNMKPDDFITEYEKALASQDWAEVDPLIHSNCTVTFSSGSVHKGKDAVEKAFRGNFAMIKDEKYKISEVHWIVKTKDFAVYTFVFNWSGIMNGKPAAGAGRGTSSLVKENGIWLLVSEHLGPKSRD